MDVDSKKVGAFSTADCMAEVEGLTSSAPAPAACAGIAATSDTKAAGTAEQRLHDQRQQLTTQSLNR